MLSKHRWFRGALLVCPLALMLSGCVGLSQPRSPTSMPRDDANVNLTPVPPERLPLPPGEYLNVVWLPDRTIAVNYVADPENVQRQMEPLKIYRLRPDGSEMRALPLPQLSGCVQTDYIVAGILPDGRLISRRDCLTGRIGEAGHADEIAIDLANLQVTSLAPLGSYNVAMAWRPRSSEGVASFAGGQCDSLTALGASGFLPAPGPVTIDGQTWYLDAVFRPGFEFSDSPDLCKPYGRARDGQYTEDGQTIAFFASPGSVGVAGRQRENVPWNLYLATPAAGGRLLDPASIRKVFTGIRDPHGMALSRDGRWVSVAGDFGSDLVGTWLIDTATGQARLLGKGLVNTTAFSPDERQVIATVFERLGGLESHLEVYTLPDR